MKLSEHFTEEEMTRSDVATRLSLDNTPPPQVRFHLEALCRTILEAVRAHFDRRVRVSSGYRSPAVNAQVGGNPHSAHCHGEAADFEVDGVSNLAVAKWIAGSDLPFDQVILEFHRAGDPHSGWVHVSYRSTVSRGPNRREVWVASRDASGKLVYTSGLP